MLDDVCEIVTEAGAVLTKYFRNLSEDQVAIKEMGGLVTKADTDAEELLIDRLTKLTPGAAILAEESGESQLSDKGRWIIDPLDGTLNFATGIPWFCVSVGYEETCGNGDLSLGVILNPITGEMFHGDRQNGTFLNGQAVSVSSCADMGNSMLGTGFYYHRGELLNRAVEIFAGVQQEVMGVRRMGSAALDLAYVACGRFEGFWENGLSPWDLAAGVLLVEAAGGCLSDYKGDAFSIYAQETVATNNKIHTKLINSIQRQ